AAMRHEPPVSKKRSKTSPSFFSLALMMLRPMHASRTWKVPSFVLAAIVCLSQSALRAQEVTDHAPPDPVIPIPESISPELQKLLRRPGSPRLSTPKTPAEWEALTEKSAASEQASVEERAKLRHRLGVTVAPGSLGGVRCYIVTPSTIKPENRRRLILNLHPG